MLHHYHGAQAVMGLAIPLFMGYLLTQQHFRSLADENVEREELAPLNLAAYTGKPE